MFFSRVNSSPRLQGRPSILVGEDGCAFLSFLLPFHKVVEDKSASMWQGLRMLAGQRRYVSFLLMAVFAGFGSACFINFVGLRLLSLGGDSGQVGLAFALNAVTEIPVHYQRCLWP